MRFYLRPIDQLLTTCQAQLQHLCASPSAAAPRASAWRSSGPSWTAAPGWPLSPASPDAVVRRVAREIDGSHGIVGDISVKEDIHPIAIQIVGELGGVDVLVNNASDLGPVPLGLLADTDCEDLERALATNVLGPFRLTKALLGALGVGARAWRRRGAERLQRRGDQRLPVLGRLRREQSGAART